MKTNPSTPDSGSVLESRREFIKVAAAATALAASATTLSAQTASEGISVLGANGEPVETWLPPATPPDISGHRDPKGLLLGPVPPVDTRELPPNELIPHHLKTLAAAQNVAASSIEAMDDAKCANLESDVVESHKRMKRVFNYIVTQAVHLVAQVNRGVVAAATGQGAAAYEGARQSYLDFVQSKAGYDKALNSLAVVPVYAVPAQNSQIGIVLGVRVIARWRNPHESSSGIPIPHG